MEYIGEKDKPAPQLKDLNIKNWEKNEAEELLQDIITNMKKLHKADLVHGDLSSFNILYHKGKVVFIDFSQATVKKNRQYDELLRRDCKNIAIFFSKNGLELSEEDLLSKITEQ